MYSDRIFHFILAYYGILTGMHIFVVTSLDKKITVEVDPADTVENLKQKIHKKEGIEPHLQHLHFGGMYITFVIYSLYDYIFN